eukprot:CAMPEP_0113921008 /NCGR_PEP_ID=MMETSP1159-20121227/850_1 /TAXON_ID=88271 /ORGANISM="Picocystis salinarum" /LENGTH=98 /DNA_ID=CAMNT_0000921021 /DNA_START=488 /DNA_END=781 /DNA_ORIENTATION=+ /assembly_acc=CAM_ASM_000767
MDVQQRIVGSCAAHTQHTREWDACGAYGVIAEEAGREEVDLHHIRISFTHVEGEDLFEAGFVAFGTDRPELLSAQASVDHRSQLHHRVRGRLHASTSS